MASYAVPKEVLTAMQRPARSVMKRPACAVTKRPAGAVAKRPAGDVMKRPAGAMMQRPCAKNEQQPSATNVTNASKRAKRRTLDDDAPLTALLSNDSSTESDRVPFVWGPGGRTLTLRDTEAWDYDPSIDYMSQSRSFGSPSSDAVESQLDSQSSSSSSGQMSVELALMGWTRD